ncbi:hypothetical protein AMETH_4737 [Amycolatopsis methanolica 239]|uniref:Uncharacterized protein n=1 Tax=Amycolatopsis methanolica 239 TaxID=1068978 RepID=A0A076MVW5_AMYME|nr:hypothetical protein AMETH_4737 [Amycolatopsis methanolica 239]
MARPRQNDTASTTATASGSHGAGPVLADLVRRRWIRVDGGVRPTTTTTAA